MENKKREKFYFEDVVCWPDRQCGLGWNGGRCRDDGRETRARHDTLVKSGAIVEAVDKETRELKLIDPRGNRLTVVADEAVINFDQIEPRDRIIIEYLESVAVVVAPAGSKPPGEDALVLSVAEAGDKPGVEGVETELMVAIVQSINAADRLVTLETEFGELRTIKVSEDARLDLVEIGDQLRLRVTRAVAVSVVAPDAS